MQKEYAMQAISSLNDLYKKYTLGYLEKKNFEGLIFKYILKNYQQFQCFDWNKDKYTDYLCWLYPRLSRAIDAYKDIGASFEGYILSIVYWSAKEYRSRELDHHLTEYACWEARAADMNVCDDEPEYGESTPVLKLVSNPRQILILLLKSYFFISDDFISRIAPAIGMKKEKLWQMIDILRKQRIERDEEARNMQERIYCQYYRCIAFEKKLRCLVEGSALYEKIQAQLKRAQSRYAGMRKRFAGINFDATNRQIADVLGIPKGTVDSTLYAIRKKIKEMPEKYTKLKQHYAL
jgi:endonuclease III-like uncharacterized protein